jgi:hypothetical protein
VIVGRSLRAEGPYWVSNRRASRRLSLRSFKRVGGLSAAQCRRLLEEFGDHRCHVRDLNHDGAPEDVVHPIELVPQVVDAIAEEGVRQDRRFAPLECHLGEGREGLRELYPVDDQEDAAIIARPPLADFFGCIPCKARPKRRRSAQDFGEWPLQPWPKVDHEKEHFGLLEAGAQEINRDSQTKCIEGGESGVKPSSLGPPRYFLYEPVRS